MTKALICAGEQTNIILSKLEYNVGGIELVGCDFTSSLEKTIASSGRLSKIIIFETGISDEFIPDIIMSNEYDVILVLNDLDLMQKYDIEYVGHNNIQIVNNNGKKVNFPFIRNLISSSKIEDYLLYKNNALDKNSFADIEEEVNENDIPEERVTIHKERVVESEDEPEDAEPKALPKSSEIEIERPKVKRQVSLEVEEDEKQKTKSIISKDNPDKDIQTIVNFYKGGCVLAFTGCPKSYTSTTVLNVGKYLAKIGLTTCIIDLDTMNNSLGVLNKKLYKEIQGPNINYTAQSLLHNNNIVSNSCLIDTNLSLITAPVIGNPITLKERIAEFEQLIINAKKFYKVIILDFQLKDINDIQPLLKLATKIIFNVPSTNKDYLILMKAIETLDDEYKLREKIFTESCYISINDNPKKKYLGTNKNDLSAIDDYLESFEYVNELKYADIPNAGNITYDKDFNDFMESAKQVNQIEIRNTILRIFGEH